LECRLKTQTKKVQKKHCKLQIANLECGGKRSATPLWIFQLNNPKRRRRPDKSGLCRRTPKALSKFSICNAFLDSSVVTSL
jgi:hypothetical protein